MITVAMITKDEERAVGEVVKNIRRVLPDAEILIVDSSADKTPEIARALGVRVIRQFPPQGYGTAMDLALRSASGDVVVTLDCDNTYPAEMIPAFARAITEEGYDLVDGSRLRSKPKAMPLVNFIGNKVFSLLASLLFFTHLTDLHSGMRAYRRSMIDALSFRAEGAALPVELLLKPLIRGYKLKVVYIDYRERLGAVKMKPLQTCWWTLKRIMGVRFGKRTEVESSE